MKYAIAMLIGGWMMSTALPSDSRALAGAYQPVAEPLPQEERVGEALERARNALRDAVDALSDAGRMTLDQQLPKLKAQTDKALRNTQQLLNQWESQLQQELEQRKSHPAIPLPPPDKEDEADLPSQLQRI
ncbi:MAG: hypothetical protein HQM06_04485 [Magnetococcales bacterium]|nr:hypothetical protein [Magnetococcales bacterium]